MYRHAAAANVTHGMTNTALFKTWSAMKARCQNPRHRQFNDYGGRGIKVCPEWSTSFDTFRSHMGDRPDGLELDRINNDGNYEPGNCRWATPKQNSNNRRSCHIIEFEGVSKTLTEWADGIQLHASSLRARIQRNWPLSVALTKRSNKHV